MPNWETPMPEWNADRPQRVGVVTVMDAVEGCSFPVSKDELIRERGDKTIELVPGQREQLKVILLRTEADEFSSVTDLVERLEHSV